MSAAHDIDSCPWPPYADGWAVRLAADFDLPAAWLLQHGTAASRAANSAGAGCGGAVVAGRRSLDSVLEEDRQISAAVNQHCNRCLHAEAIMHADLAAMKDMDDEWYAMQTKAAAITTATAAAAASKAEQKEGADATATTAGRSIDELVTPRLCKRHRAVLVRLLSSAAAPAPTSSQQLLLQPTPQPRAVHAASHGATNSAHAAAVLPPSTWAELDDFHFQRCYTLPEPRSRPATPTAVAPAATNGRIAPASASGASSSSSAAAAVAPTPSAVTASVAASAASTAASTAAAAPSSPPHKKARKSKSALDRSKHLAIDMVAGAAGKPSQLDLPSSLTLSAEDEGRRSGRVSRLKMEAEQAELRRLEESARRRAREAEDKQARQELDQIARIKQQQLALEGGASAGSSGGAGSGGGGSAYNSDAGVAPVSLLSFPSLLSRAAPEGLVDHASEYLSKTLLSGGGAGPTSSSAEAAPMCSIQLAMRLMEVAVFARDPSLLSKNCAPHAQGSFARAIHTLRATLREEASIALPLPLHALKQSLLQPDLLGLTPLHVAIKLGCEEAVNLLLDELHEGAAELAASSAHNAAQPQVAAQSSSVCFKGETAALKSPSPSPSAAAAAAAVPAVATAPAAPPARSASNPAPPDSLHLQVRLTKRATDKGGVVYSHAAVKQTPVVKLEEQKSNHGGAHAPAAAAVASAAQQLLQFPALAPSALQAAESVRRSELQSLRSLQLQSREACTAFSLTPLLYAVACGHTDDSTYALLRALVDRGAAVLDTDAQGNDALMWSAQRGFPRCLEFLVREATKAALALAASAGEGCCDHFTVSETLLAARNDLGNTALHAAIASAMDAECAGCVECLSIHVADIAPDEETVSAASSSSSANTAATTPAAADKDAMEDDPTSVSPSPAPSSAAAGAAAAPLFTSTRLLPLDAVPPFVLPLLLRLQPLLLDPTLERVVREALWKSELRIRPGIIEEPSSQMLQQIEEQRQRREASKEPTVAAREEAAAAATEMEIEEERKEPSTTRAAAATATAAAAAAGSSSSPSPLPALPASTLPLPPLFVALLRLWRQLLHRDSRLVAAPHLSPLVAELASLLPLTLFLEAAASTTGRRSKGQQEIVLVRASPESRCKRTDAAADCVRILRQHGAGGNYEEARNKHGLTPADLLDQWSELSAATAPTAIAATHAAASARALAAQQWRAHFRGLLQADGWVSRPSDAAVPLSKDAMDTEAPVEWGPTRYFERHPNRAASAGGAASGSVATVATAFSSPCAECGAGMLAPCPSTPAHAPLPSCVCLTHPAYEPKSAAAAAAGSCSSSSSASLRVLKQSNLWHGEQKEPLLLPVLNALDGCAPAPPSASRMYTRTALYAQGDLHRERIVAQANSLTPACNCTSGGCNPLSGCACSAHRFGTADPVHAAATGASAAAAAATARPTLTCLFECHRLCGCRCSLGGPHTLDLRRFEPRARTQLLRHASGWRLHTLEPLSVGSYFCEYAAEVLSGSASGVRGLEYSYHASSNGRRSSGAGAGAGTGGGYLMRVVHTTPQAAPPAPAAAAGNKTQAEADKRDKLAQSIARFGNVCSFVRHACAGNLVPVLLYTAASHVPRIMLVASRQIARGEELTLMHDAQDCVKHSMQIKPNATINLYAA